MAIYKLDLKIKKVFGIGLFLMLAMPQLSHAQYIISEKVILGSKSNSVEINHRSDYAGLLLVYKKFISSQDGPSCRFQPSCSVYAHRAIKNNGLFVGWLATSDRLLRCSIHSDEYYLTDENDFFIDP